MPDREPTEAFAGSAEIGHELRCSAALSCNPDTKAALDEVCRQACAELGTTADLAMLFASPHHAQGLEQAASVIAREIPVNCLLGCTGQAIVGTGREVEATPALSLWVASLPQASILPMHLEYQQTPDGGTFVGWPDETPDQWPPGAVLLLLGDPFQFPRRRPGVPAQRGPAGDSHCRWHGQRRDRSRAKPIAPGSTRSSTRGSRGDPSRPVPHGHGGLAGLPARW